jgi:hypothetical protein
VVIIKISLNAATLNASDSVIGTEATVASETSPSTIPSSDSALNCSEGFFSNFNGTLCSPECGKFNPKSRIALALEVISACTGVIASTLVLLLLAFTVEGRRVL